MQSELTSIERMNRTLNHKEPDRIPFDLGSTSVGGIAIKAYKLLLDALGIKKEKIEIDHLHQQLAKIDEDVLVKLKVDTRGFNPVNISGEGKKIYKKGDYYIHEDEYGIVRSMPVEGGYYYDITKSPLSGDIDLQGIKSYNLPQSKDFIDGLKLRNDIHDKFSQTQCAVVVRGSSQLVERVLFLRGFEDGLIDFAGNFEILTALLDKIVENNLQFLDTVLESVGDTAHIIQINDDLGSQEGLLFSPDTYRKYIKPRHKKIFSYIKEKAPHIKIFLHSCGSIYDLIGDFIEIGVDILNPVQVSARKMDTKQLKKEFGNDITFWGGIDTQYVLPYGSSEEIRDEVKRRIDDLAPGGGFVFNTVHNIQADVPPENYITMWETFQEYCKY